MNIVPLASDSMGVRSLSLFVEQEEGTSILIDGGVRLGPRRFGLPPTELEKRALDRYTLLMEEGIRRADIVVISHYHYDHYIPDSTLYEGKILYVKDPENLINPSQRTRGTLFCDMQEDVAEVIPADGREFRHDDILLRFSQPVPHGEDDSNLGFVIMTGIRDEIKSEMLLHTSDVQGPVSMRTCEKIIEIAPDILVMDGAPTYLREWKDPFILERVEENLLSILDSLKGTIIMDHHNLRDSEWSHFFRKAFRTGRIMNFSEFQHIIPLMLESRRKEIWRAEHGKGREIE